jgi:hypothetical protein
MNRDKWEKTVESNGVVEMPVECGYTFDQVMWNRNCSKEPKYWYRVKDTNKFLFRSEVAESWEFQIPTIENPIRNMDQIYLYFKDVSKFIEPQTKFRIFKRYTLYGEDEFEYDVFWDEEEAKILKGFVVDGVRITGRYYFMLNFTTMLRKVDNKRTKDRDLPSFVDMQYYLLNELEHWFLDSIYNMLELYKDWFPLATDEDFYKLVIKSGVVPKARRKGLTYVAGNAIAAYDYVFVPNSFTLLAAGNSEYTEALRTDAIDPTITHINDHTPFVRRNEVKGSVDERRASFKDYTDAGVLIERGYMSTLKYLTFYNNSFGSVGRSASKFLVDEAGLFPNIIDTKNFSIDPLIREGDIRTGSAILWGSAGDMNKGSIGLSKMAYNPEQYSLASYANIYDKVSSGTSSLFMDDLWFKSSENVKAELDPKKFDKYAYEFLMAIPGRIISAVDANGNSYRFLAQYNWDIRYDIKKSDPDLLTGHLTQEPRYLQDAFYVKESAGFNVPMIRQAKLELRDRMSSMVQRTGLFMKKGDGSIVFDETAGSAYIASVNRNTDKVPGCWCLWCDIPKGNISQYRYIAGTDPIQKGYEESSDNNLHSLGSTWILDIFTGLIVAEYTGRPARVEEYNKNLLLGLRAFNCKTMYEANITGLQEYCKLTGQLQLLENEPAILKAKFTGYKSGVAPKGFHTTPEGKAWLREELARFLEEEVAVARGDNDEVILAPRYYTINSMAFLEELEAWNNKGNFDRISGAMALVLYYLDVKDRYFTLAAEENVAKTKSDDVWRRMLKRHYR